MLSAVSLTVQKDVVCDVGWQCENGIRMHFQPRLCSCVHADAWLAKCIPQKLRASLGALLHRALCRLHQRMGAIAETEPMQLYQTSVSQHCITSLTHVPQLAWQLQSLWLCRLQEQTVEAISLGMRVLALRDNPSHKYLDTHWTHAGHSVDTQWTHSGHW